MKKHQCDQCKLRAKYDRDPKSVIGRFWRWHINFCPGWKSYMRKVDDPTRDELKNKYQL